MYARRHLSYHHARRALFFAIAISMTLVVGFLLSSHFLPRHEVSAAQTIPYKMNFQGRLTNSAGNIMPDGLYNVQFRIYDAASGGTQLWSETRETTNRIQVTNGLFSVQLGDVSSLTPGLFTSSSPRYFEITLATPATVNCSTAACATWESPMTPRQAMASSGYAFNSDTVDGIDGSSLARNDTDNTFIGNTQTFRNTANSVSAFQVQNAAGTNVLNVNTQDGIVYAGTLASAAGLVVSSAQNATPLYLQTSTHVLSTYLGSGGGYNGAWLGTGTNHPLLFYTNNASTPSLALNANGSATFRNYTNTASAFRVQNATGTTALNVDTTTLRTTLQDTTIGAGKSISFVGGATGTRPASPTEGMVYYDQTTKQLLTYANGKWQADRSTATKIVAASNSPQALKDSADYVADGTADQTEINTALTAAAGGVVYLAEGTYVANATILIPNNTTLTGAGRGTLIELADIDVTDNLIENSDQTTGIGVTIQDLRIDGRKDLNTAGTQRGIYFNNMGGGSGSPARQGAKVTNVIVNSFRNHGIFLDISSNNVLAGNTVQGNGSYGITLSTSSNNTITGNITQGNNNDGIYFFSSSNNTITGNTMQGNSNGIYLSVSSSTNTISGNTVQGNINNGIAFQDSSNNTINGNTIQSNGLNGIQFTIASNNNTVSGNTFHDNGGSTDNNAMRLASSDSNTITGNTITDTSATTTNYAVNVTNSTADTNYLADNTLGGGTINDLGTGTIYANQLDSNGVLLSRSSGGLQLQAAAGTNVLMTNSTAITIGAVDATGTLLTLDTKNTDGDPTGVNGSMYYNSFMGEFRCYTAGAWGNCGGAGSTGEFIQNGTAVQTANFNIQSASSASIGAIVRGAAFTGADILQVQMSDGTPSLQALSNGTVKIGTNDPAGALTVGSSTSTLAGTTVLQVLSEAGSLKFIHDGDTTPNELQLEGYLRVNPGSFGTGVVASFNGRVIGADAVNDNEFITKDQLDTAIAGVGGGSYINNSTTQQTNADFNIDGTGTAAVLQASIFDTAIAGVLQVGSTNATAINLNQDTTVASGQSLNVGAENSYSTTASTGTFATKVDYTVGDEPEAIATADFNGDGTLDLATANENVDTVSILINNRDGTFAAKVDYATGDSPRSITSGDFDGDSEMDLAVGNYFADTVSILINNGDGTFAAKVDYAVDNPISLVSADFDGDGAVDIAASRNDQVGIVAILYGNGDGTFTTPPASYATADWPAQITAADFDGDGNVDVATSHNSTSTISVLLSNGDGTFAANAVYAGDGGYGITHGDFDGDGAEDLAVGYYNGDSISIYLNNGDGTFAAKVNYPAGDFARIINSNDLNGDGVDDLVATNGPADTISVLLSNGDGTFATPASYTAGDNPYTLLSGDFDGDGAVDVVVANHTPDSVSVFISDTTTSNVNSAASIRVTTSGEAGLILQGSSGQTADLLRAQDASGNNLFRVTANGSVRAHSFITDTAGDLAEYYPTAEKVKPAEVVAFTATGKLELADKAMRDRLAGVISTEPGLVLSKDTGGAPLALSGRVPVKISDENGAVRVGDYLTGSSTPGVAMKATSAGQVIGRALEAHSDGIGTIEVFVENSYYNPLAGEHLQGGGDGVFTSLVINGTITTDDLVVTGDVKIKGDLHVGGHFVTTGETPTIVAADEACVVATIEGTDTSGTIVIETKADCQATDELAKVTFDQPFSGAPRVIISVANEAASGVDYYRGATTETGFELNVAGALVPDTTYRFDYFTSQ